MKRVLQLTGIAALVLSACNYTEGSCWIDGEDSGGVGAGGGPIGPGWGGYGDVPPEPLSEDENTVECAPQGKWSKIPECDLQYEQDTSYCYRFHKAQEAAKCRAVASERLAYCNKTGGQTGHPPRYKGGKND